MPIEPYGLDLRDTEGLYIAIYLEPQDDLGTSEILTVEDATVFQFQGIGGGANGKK
jgi:hypothetical protein